MGYDLDNMAVEAGPRPTGNIEPPTPTTGVSQADRRGLVRRTWDRMSPTGRVTLGLVSAGVAYGAVRTGAVDVAVDAIRNAVSHIPGLQSLHTDTGPATIDPSKCFTVPGTEARPLDVCEVVK